MTYQMYIANKIAAIVTMCLCAIMIIVAIKSIILIRQSDKQHGSAMVSGTVFRFT